MGVGFTEAVDDVDTVPSTTESALAGSCHSGCLTGKYAAAVVVLDRVDAVIATALTVVPGPVSDVSGAPQLRHTPEMTATQIVMARRWLRCLADGFMRWPTGCGGSGGQDGGGDAAGGSEERGAR